VSIGFALQITFGVGGIQLELEVNVSENLLLLKVNWDA